MSTTLIDGGPAGPDEAGGQYRNRILTDRTTWWEALGGRQGLVRGFAHSTVGGQMALEFTPGLALVEERDALGAVGTSRGYAVWSDDTTVASFGVASAADRNDAVVIAFVDVAAGAAALGTETSTVGGQVVVVPGVSGTTTPRTDADIQAAVGSGGWVRYADVLIPASSTEIGAGNVTKKAKTTDSPTAWARATSAQSIPNNATTVLTMHTSTTKGPITVSGNTVVIDEAGMYVATTTMTLVSGAGRGALAIRLDGSNITRSSTEHGGTQSMSCSIIRRFEVGAVIDAVGFQTSTGDPHNTSDPFPHLSVTKVAD